MVDCQNNLIPLDKIFLRTTEKGTVKRVREYVITSQRMIMRAKLMVKLTASHKINSR